MFVIKKECIYLSYTNKQKQIIMLVIKDKKLAESYDYFTRFGKGSFNFNLYAEILAAKGINPEDKLEFIKRAKNIKK